MTAVHDSVMAALRTVPEPCSLLMRAPTNLVDMGLVDSVVVGEDGVRVELVLTDPSCVHFAAMRRYIADALTTVDGVGHVEVTASTTVLWTPERVTAPGASPSEQPAPGGEDSTA